MENFEKIYLEPVFDNRKSFYKKAIVLIDKNGNRYLQSYNSIIAEIIDGQVKINTEVYLWDSSTSLRHLKDFLYQFGYKVGTKQQLKEMYG